MTTAVSASPGPPPADPVGSSDQATPTTHAAPPIPPAPAGPAGVFAAFCEAGLWPGVGPALAKQLAAAGITRAEQVSVDALSALPAVNGKRAERLFTAWIGVLHTFALAELLVPQEIPIRWCARLVDLLGEDAAARLVADPWQLLGIAEATVAQADRLALALDPGVRREDARRGRALVDWTLARFARHGHTWAPVDLVAQALRPFGIDADRALADAEREATITRFGVPVLPGSDDVSAVVDGDTATGAQGVARVALAGAEASIAGHLDRLRRTAKTLAGARAVRACCDGLDEVQAGAVGLAATEGVSILTGGPGTGKSRTIAAVVALCAKVDAEVALAAPTGRAAKRLEELASHPASTIHKLLGAWRRPESGGAASGFDRDADNPIEAALVVVDETSMLDVELAALLLAAIPDGTHLVLVGDPAQLPSIGPGRLLGDAIDSAVVPITELRRLYRQSEGGAIARLATAVRAGELPPPETDEGREVVLVPCRGSDEAARRVVQLATDSIPRVFGARDDALQVVTPVHRGPAGTLALNRALKAVLNPGSGTVRGFDVGDRVVATANHPEAEPTGFANGEVGVVVAAGDNTLRVAFTGGEAQVGGKMVGDLLHGWAITVHRAQGSEWEAVVAVLPPEAGAMLSRPLVYTALTRARRHLSVVQAAGPALARAVREVGAEPRRTRVAALLAARAAATGNEEET